MSSGLVAAEISVVKHKPVMSKSSFFINVFLREASLFAALCGKWGAFYRGEAELTAELILMKHCLHRPHHPSSLKPFFLYLKYLMKDHQPLQPCQLTNFF